MGAHRRTPQPPWWAEVAAAVVTQHRVVRDLPIWDQPHLLPILRDMGHTTSDRRADAVLVDRFPAPPHLASVDGLNPAEHVDQLTLPVPVDPSDPQDLPTEYLEIDTVQAQRATVVGHRQARALPQRLGRA